MHCDITPRYEKEVFIRFAMGFLYVGFLLSATQVPFQTRLPSTHAILLSFFLHRPWWRNNSFFLCSFNAMHRLHHRTECKYAVSLYHCRIALSCLSLILLAYLRSIIWKRRTCCSELNCTSTSIIASLSLLIDWLIHCLDQHLSTASIIVVCCHNALIV